MVAGPVLEVACTELTVPETELHALPPVVRKVQTGWHPGEVKKFTKVPLVLKLNIKSVAVAERLPPLTKTVPPLTPLVRLAVPVPSFNVRLNVTMSKVKSVPIVPSVVIVPLTKPGPTGALTW